MLSQLGTFSYVGENNLRISLVRFQNGVVIIDSPGVGDSEIMDEIVREYLPEAFAFTSSTAQTLEEFRKME